MIDAQSDGEDGRSVCLMNRPFEVPERIHTAGRARRDGKRGRGLGCGKLSVGGVVGREGFIVTLLDGMVLGGCFEFCRKGGNYEGIFVYTWLYIIQKRKGLLYTCYCSVLGVAVPRHVIFRAANVQQIQERSRLY